MLKFRDEIRVEVLMARGIADPSYLGEIETPLDEAIIKFARRELRDSHKFVFFFAYHCAPNWEAIRKLYSARLYKKVQLATIRRSAAEAARRLHDRAPGAKELEDWEAAHRGRSRPQAND